MRVHKYISPEYEPFFKSLQQLDLDGQDFYPGVSVFTQSSGNNVQLLEKYAHLLQNLSSLSFDVDSISDPVQISEKLKTSVKRIIPAKESVLLFFDDEYRMLHEIGKNDKSETQKAMNHFYTEGVLNLLFEANKPMILPELSSYNSDGPKLNFVIIPILDEGKKRGLFAILTSLNQKQITELDKEFLRIILGICLPKIEKGTLKSKLNATLEELQVYQAKLSNDFRLSAIGELTEGIVEDIISPLQVIISQIDLISEELDDSTEIKQIKSQINKINSVISRLVKFANINQKNVRIQPCNLNTVINDYYTLVNSTLNSVNLECVLDFENNIPSILSHPNYIFQLLTNVLGLIKNESKNGGGIIIQTRYKSDYLLLKIVTTSKLKPFGKNKTGNNSSIELNVKIIQNLMNKHEGEFFIENFDGTGSSISLKFPLKRKIRS